MTYLHDAQLANIVTSYCTCLAGIIPLVFTLLTRPQPRRWLFAYACILITGIPTVWLHSMEGYRLASFFDVGTNILLAWAMIVAVSGDFLSGRSRKTLLQIVTPLNLIVLCWLLYEIFAPEKRPIIRFGSFGEFYTGEVALILNCWVVTALFVANLRQIPQAARPLLYTVVGTFLVGMFMATASNKEVTFRILPWHAMWHIVGGAGFITLWLFNHTRFNELHSGTVQEEEVTPSLAKAASV